MNRNFPSCIGEDAFEWVGDRNKTPHSLPDVTSSNTRYTCEDFPERAVEAALSATVHALPPALEPPRHGGELWELLRRRWCELTAPWRELIAAGTSWRELLQDLELRLDLDLGSEDDFEDREYVRGLFEAEYAEAMSYEGHD